jgi:O-antigen chain-terminating methyltransferase
MSESSDLPKRTVTEADLTRLKAQREQADSRYDEALTRLDAARFGLPDFPHPPPGPDESQVTPLNTRWEVLRARPVPATGWRGRLARLVWGLVEPVLAEQQAFNSLVVDHINRNVQPQREVIKSIETTIAVLREQVAKLVSFHSTLLHYLQRITPFVNSKDYEFAALARRTHEDGDQNIRAIARTQRALSDAIEEITDRLLKEIEALKSHVHRYDARIEGAAAATSVVQQQTAALQREVARRLEPMAESVAPVGVAASPGTTGELAGRATLAGDSSAEAWKYPAFEAAFRGSEADIGERLAGYVTLFASTTNVLDVGCGRGEFLDQLRARGIAARGLDLNYEMVEICRARGLDVAHGDALTYLRGLADQSLGGLFAAQVVEHLMPEYLLAFLSEAQRVLRSGSPLVLETVNVACWYAFFESYVRDITHARPIHPDTLKYLVTASGFSDATVEFRVPVPEADRLQRPPHIVWQPTGEDKDAITTLAQTVDGNAVLLNRLLFTTLDYAVIARRA